MSTPTPLTFTDEQLVAAVKADDTVIANLTPDPIKANSEWNKYCYDVSTSSYGAGGTDIALNAGEVHVQKSGATDGIFVMYSDEGTAGQTKVIIEANGDLTNRTNSYTGISDERTKSNIKEYRDPTDDLMAMKVISYERTHFMHRTETGEIVRKKDGIGRHEIGWGAQSIAKIKPGFVKENPETTELAVKTSLFIPLLHRGFQVHNERLDKQDARIAFLESEIAALKAG
jgi:hypothetical protein